MAKKYARAIRMLLRDKRAAPPAYDSEDIDRINAVIDNARPTWFALLGVLVFCGITLLGVRDVDFFALNQRTQLPLVNVQVPIESFFLAGAAFSTAAYVYLHLYLEFLWMALGSAAPRFGDDPVSEHIKPWQVAEWGLRHRDWLRERLAGAPLPESARCSSRRDLSLVSSAMSILFVWLFGPLVLFCFWWRSMPAHVSYLSILTGLLFAFSAWICWRSARRADRLLAGTLIEREWHTLPLLVSCRCGSARTSAGPPQGDSLETRPATRFALRSIGIATAIVLISLVRTGSAFCEAPWDGWFDEDGRPTVPNLCKGFDWAALMAVADLSESSLVEQPRDWKNRKEAERDFRAVWAKREGVPYGDPFKKIAARDWEAEFQTVLARRKGVRDGTASAEARQALADDDFRLEWAEAHDLQPMAPFPPRTERNVEGAFLAAWSGLRDVYLYTLPKPSLDDQNLRGADLGRAFLAGIQIRGARLEGAKLFGAVLEGADFSSASLDGADFSFASLENANLFGANFEAAKLPSALLRGAELSSTNFKGANLSGADLNNADLKLARFDRASLEGANLKGVDLQGASFKETDLSGVNLEDANLQETTFADATLVGAKLNRANFSSARVFGTAERPLDLAAAGLDTKLSYTALRWVVLNTPAPTEMPKLATSFGDASTKLPDGYARPCQWGKTALSDAEFFGRWRGWLEAAHRDIPIDIEKYPAIRPPQGCKPADAETANG